ncbi:DUF4097 family beta strand repeat-containing protein [Saccharothrix xinjiangensis]|uniref:DUF4097 family beta strand repeat-containing protein n=1 Tax=Saccharothrix xinjiangensis TaxID=204798 RepID=A0ABV9Y5E2_9PSEU
MVGKRFGLAAVAVVTAAVALTSCVRLVHHGFEDQHTVTQSITEVRLRNGSGEVVVRSGTGATSTDVRRRLQYPKNAERPSGASHRVEGTTLVLDGCGDRCTVDYEVVVPSADVRVVGENDSGDVRFEGVASVEVEVGSGNAEIRDVSGLIRIRNDSGDVSVVDVGGEFTGWVGSGNANLSDMRGEVTVDSNSGDVDVSMTAATSVHAVSGSGNVTVRVPRTPYRVDVDTGSGEQVVRVPNDPDAPVQLFLRASSGDVEVLAV